MELIARFFYSLTVYLGWLVAPIYAVLAFRQTKLLPALKRPDILNLSATKLARKIRQKELSSEQVVSAFIERCRDVNVVLNAIVEDRFVAAIEDARNVDRLINSGQKTEEQLEMEFPLLGVPVTIKEACKLGGLSYSVGAKLREGTKADEDGETVAKLKRAGAIPIAVTNTPELCASVETFNYVTGYTVNPYDTTRSSGGSSGGEAALISSGASVFGVGSDFAGSIRVPCLFTGIYGHKPTPGIVSNEGHYPNLLDKEYQKLLTIGPMCRYAEDLKPALKIMAGENAVALNLDLKVNMQDLEIYYMLDKGFSLCELSVNADFKKSIKMALEYFETTYGCTVQKLDLPELDNLTEICIMQAADVDNLKEVFYLKGAAKESNLYLELIKVLTHFSDYCLQTVIMRFVVESLLFIPCYKRFKYSAERNDLGKKLKEILGENGIFIFPTFTIPAFHKYQLLWKVSSLAYPMMVNVLGLPSTHVPAGLNKKGLPIGFQVIAGPYQDRLCIAVAQELEKLFGGWVPPPCL